MMNNLPEFYDVKYMGGHIEYPKSSYSRMYFYNERIELENPRIVIPYQSITNIQNADEKTISALRVVMFGIVGALWKKKHLYTIIQYKDSVDEKIVVLDFDDNVDAMQPFIYRRMMRHRRSPTLRGENNYLVYENRDYGFRITYPESWYEDELNQDNDGYMTVVEFRRFIENKSPFVTIYVNAIHEKNISAEHYINEGIKELENDPTVTILENSEKVCGNNSGTMLIDVDTNGYKRMVFWVPFLDKVYELSYSTVQEQYLENLPDVENMFKSLEIIETIKQQVEKPVANNTLDETDPLVILKRRFAKGEINEEDYQRMKHVLQE